MTESSLLGHNLFHFSSPCRKIPGGFIFMAVERAEHKSKSVKLLCSFSGSGHRGGGGGHH
jgi:hypothetical protein